MSYNSDIEYARRLQAEFDSEEAGSSVGAVRKTQKRAHDEDDLNATINIVHPAWETLDPTPDIATLFAGFNMKFFQNRLCAVELEWSARMYQCAGICYHRSSPIGKSIIIRLSRPLLKLRSRRDLIQTLLHEMIHAYLFVLCVREPNGGHGPNFHRIMNNINKVAGTNITVYHTFNDEVEHYRQHIWRCNGICQHRKPFFGYIKRTSNRAPGPNDVWWPKHLHTCSGTFIKIASPKRDKAAPEEPKKKKPLITDWAMPISPLKRYTKMPSLEEKIKTAAASTDDIASPIPTTPIPNDFIVLRDLNTQDFPTLVKPRAPKAELIGELYTPSQSAEERRKTVREHWLTRGLLGDPEKREKQPRANVDDELLSLPAVTLVKPSTDWEQFGDGLYVETSKKNRKSATINIDDDPPPVVSVDPRLHPNRDFDFTQRLVDHLKESIDTRDTTIELIDDEYDNLLSLETQEIVSDTHVIDEIFGTDTLMDDFNSINNVIMRYPENKGNMKKEIIACPICGDRLAREQWAEHLEGCEGFRFKVTPNSKIRQHDILFQKIPVLRNQDPEIGILNRDLEMFLKAGYTREEVKKMIRDANANKPLDKKIVNEGEFNTPVPKTVGEVHPKDEQIVDNRLGDVVFKHPNRMTECPVCNTAVKLSEMNEHLDECLLYNDPPDLNQLNSTIGSIVPGADD